MLFSSMTFLIVFLPCVLFIYFVPLRKHRIIQNYFLLVASLAFYAWGEPWFVAVIVLSVIGNWILGIKADEIKDNPAKAKPLLVLMLIFNLSILFSFKYLGFVVHNTNALFGANIQVPDLPLPIGISFFTFQAISYVLDIYRGRADVQRNLFNVGLYIAFFPQLVAGPIVRYQTIADQIMNRKETFNDFSLGSCRFMIGLAKKVLISNNLAIVADQSFALAGTGDFSVAFAWLGALAYTFQIYFDFSGYSDMAIGLGRMFGFHFPENFNYPYISKSLSEFWRRWHISLGNWFRDYVYFPLGGSRVASKARLVFNLFVVWGLTGIWHGANWTFISWGLLYFVFLTMEKLTGFEKNERIPIPVKHIYTMLFVIMGWVLFRSNTISDAGHYLSVMFGLSGQPLIDANFTVFFKENMFFFIFGAIFSMPVANKISEWAGKRFATTNPAVAAIYAAIIIGGLLISVSYLIKGAYNPFIYFNF
ncbi:MAG: MBOAT family protein [Eubacteriales bacterium]|nr:MBOAT family protein [Eubacteriales bacterium]MDD4390478.1 MBOAT family protein [Eubacteriales bacterium]